MSKGRYTSRGIYQPASAAGGASLAQSKVAGRGSASGAGVYEQIDLGPNLSMSGTTLNAAGGVGGGVTVADEDSYLLLPHGLFQAGVGSFFLSPTARVFVTRFWIPFEFKFDDFTFYVSIAGTVDAVVHCGIYSNDGATLHAQSGAVAAIAGGEKTAALGSAVTLSGGFYLLAFGAESTGNLPYVQAFTALAQIWSAVNTATSSGAIGYGANTISGAALPTSVGAITTTSNAAPWVVLGGST